MYRSWWMVNLHIPCILLNHINGDWVAAPPTKLISLTGDNLTLVYGYSKDPSYDTPVGFTIGHYVPGRTYEDILFEGNLDPITGHIEVKHNYEPNKINVTSYLGGFSIRVGNLSVSDSGQYLTDFKFNVYDSRHHGVTLTVYNRPYFSNTPSSDDVIAQKDSDFIMQWTLADVSSQPAIDSLQIKHQTAGVFHTLIHQQSLNIGQWGITYPDEKLHFKGRLSYAPGPNLERVDLNLRKLQVEDTGVYSINIAYIDGLINLTDSVQLHVASGFGWISAPRSTTYIIESSAHTFYFSADSGNSTVINTTYELSKLTCEDKRETLVSLLITGDSTSQKSYSSWNSGWRLQYNRSTHSMLVQVPNVLATDEGNYTIALKSETENILAYHRFSVIVINEATLNPKINKIVNGQAITLEIRVDELVPKPYIIVYGDNTEEPHASARTNTLNTSISRPQEHVVVLVKYDSEDMQYIKRHLVDITDDGSDHVTHSEGLTNRSTYQTAITCVIPDEVLSCVNYHVLFSLEIVSVSMSISLVLMCLYYIIYWIHPHIKRTKLDVRPAESFTEVLGTSGYNTYEPSRYGSRADHPQYEQEKMHHSGNDEPQQIVNKDITNCSASISHSQEDQDTPNESSHQMLHGYITNPSATMSHLQEEHDTTSESSWFLQSPDNEDPSNGYPPADWTYLSASPKIPHF